MPTPPNEQQKAILSRIVGRFFNLGRGTPVQRTRKLLGGDRKILDGLVEGGYLRIVSDEYLPTLSAIEQLDANATNLGRRLVGLSLMALKSLYLEHDRNIFSFDEILHQVKSLDPTMDEKDLGPGLILASEFRFFSSYAGPTVERERLKIDQIQVNESILDYQSVEETLTQLAAEEAARRQALVSQQMQPLAFRKGAADIDSDPLGLREVTDFSFVVHSKLREIVERDYKELNAIRTGIKSRMILAGGLIEALLLDSIQQDEKRARGSRFADTRPFDEWSLSTLIAVAVDLDLVSEGVKQLGHAVREFRNLVHPGKEIRGTYVVGQHEAHVAELVARMVIRDLLQRKPGKT